MLEAIFHPSDFTETSQVAFCHALRLGLLAHARVQMVHVSEEHSSGGLKGFPSVRDTLERWQMLPADATRQDVGRLGIDLDKIVIHDNNVVDGIRHFLVKHPASLLIMAAHQREGWFDRSDLEPIFRAANAPTLFLPDSAPGFVSEATGDIRLRQIVVPVTVEPGCAPAIDALTELLEATAASDVTIHLLHVSNDSSQPAVPTGFPADCEIEVTLLEGDGRVADTITGFAKDHEADLVVMVTAGREGFLDYLRGSTTEQVLQQIHCPLLAVPSE